MNITKLVGIVSVIVTSSGALAQDPRITRQPTNTAVSLGTTARLQVYVSTTNGPLTYQWYFKNAPLDAAANPSVITTRLSLTNVTLAQAGSYFVAVTNAAGSSTNSDVAVLEITIDQFEAVELKSIGITNVSCASWGSAWGDYDNDGRIDLYVANTGTDGSSAFINFLYRNNGDGTFTRKFAAEVGPPAGDRDPSGGYCFWGDVNNDGFLDLLVGNGPAAGGSPVYCRLYQNEGNGHFTWVSGGDLGIRRAAAAGIFGDYDNDGFLDVFLATQWASFGVYTNALLHGLGDGTFGIVTNSVVATDELKTALANTVTWADCDNDGDLDLIVAHYTAIPFYYRNDGHGQFTRMTNSALEQTTLQIAGVTFADYDSDGFQDLLAGGPKVALFRNDGSGEFVPSHEWNILGGGSWGDYDNDGDLDLIINSGQDSPTKNILFRNNGDGTWTSVPDAPCRIAGRWECVDWGDYDNDGFLDLWINNVIGSNALYRNLGHANGNANHWIKFHLIGTASNASAIGAKVRVKATIGGKVFWQMREVSAGQWCPNDLRPNIGLGDATTVEVVRIEWPSGLVQEFQNVPADQILKITEHQEGTIPPPNLSATRSVEGSVQLTLTGEKNFLYVFEGSTDLVKWLKLGVRTNLTGTVEFTDTFAARYPHRFYRGVAP